LDTFAVALVTSHRQLLPAVSGLGDLPDTVRASAQWWERHLLAPGYNLGPAGCNAQAQ
jgi:hypothetical protein